MKRLLLTLGLGFFGVACHTHENRSLTLDEYSQQRGPPVVVAPAYRFENGELPTVSLYELDRSPLAALVLNRDRYLIYTTDEKFAHKVAWHFQSMRDPKAWTGSTMYAAPWTVFVGASAPTVELEILHFDARGLFVAERRLRIHIAYLEAGAEGHEIRKPTAR